MNDFFLKVGSQEVKITNPDRILFPKSSISKWSMIQYYQRIASFMIPHIKNRPISMQRFPNGIDGEGFYQKDASGYFPEWIKIFDIEKVDKTKVVHHVLCNNVQTLVYLANQAVITPHVWLSKVNNIHCPDRLIFDLDPPSVKQFDEVRKSAKIFKSVLEDLGLHPFVMTTGSKGLHVTVPIKPDTLFDDVRSFARDIAELMVKQNPEILTLEMRKENRKGKIFADYLRNAWAQTGVAPYAIRAKKGAPIATPLQWKEVNSQLSSQKYTIKNIFRRVSRIGDPWQDINAYAKSIKSIKL
ncbi:MAG: non-homologous end-joining DNA ligase [Candidatus Dependentiae bacterium]